MSVSESVCGFQATGGVDDDYGIWMLGYVSMSLHKWHCLLIISVLCHVKH